MPGRHASALVRFVSMVLLAFTGSNAIAATSFDPAWLGPVKEASSGGIVVRTAVPNADAIQRIFGVPVIEKGVQPVWLQIVNGSDKPLWYMPITTDETYFAPLEVAYRFHDTLDPRIGLDAAATMQRLAMPLAVPAGGSASGFVFTHLETGLKFLRFGMLKDGDEIDFRFIVPVAGPAYQGERLDFATMYRPDEIKNVDLAGLRDAIEAMPCCTVNADGTKQGDPLNLVVVGNGLDSIFAFVDRGWRLTEPLDIHSAVDTAKSFLIGTQYETSPVSPLYALGRHQDLALQKARSTIDERNHARFWLTPLRYEGQSVWIGQISRDIGVELTTKSWYLTTHKISPSVDFDRDYLLQDILRSGAVEHFGYAKGVGASTAADPRVNLTDDPYVTDGLRLVLMLDAGKSRVQGVDALEWEPLPEPSD